MTEIIQPNKAFLIVDNGFLVMLTDCFCDRFASRYPQNLCSTQAELWIDGIFTVIKQFSIDGNILCTNSVASEYIPHAGPISIRLSSQKGHLDHLQNHVRSQLQQIAIPEEKLLGLRHLQGAPKALIDENTGLSNNDLSLVQLGLNLLEKNVPIYILSNDQSLLSFTSWIRTQKKIFPGQNPSLIQGWRCLTYLELIHRGCKITTDLMKSLIEFALIEHYNRNNIGIQKGNTILSDLLQIYANFNQSVVIKSQLKANPV